MLTLMMLTATIFGNPNIEGTALLFAGVLDSITFGIGFLVCGFSSVKYKSKEK